MPIMFAFSALFLSVMFLVFAVLLMHEGAKHDLIGKVVIGAICLVAHECIVYITLVMAITHTLL